MPEGERPTAGLRERKKAKTKAAIQLHALQLFRRQGYAATTVEQIAEAAEVSPSTFFRYFPTKEDVVLYDMLDPVIFEALQAQPAELTPIQALRATMRSVFATLPAEEREVMDERLALMRSTPELRAKELDQFAGMLRDVSQAVAVRVGRRADEFAVRTLAGALLGVFLSVWYASIDDPTTDVHALLDAALAQLEAGLPL